MTPPLQRLRIRTRREDLQAERKIDLMKYPNWYKMYRVILMPTNVQ